MTAKTRRPLRPSFDRLDGRILLTTTALGPAQIKQAYSLNMNFNVNGQSYAANGAGQTIAIVVGEHDASIGNDLAAFDRAFNLPAPPSFRVATYANTTSDEAGSNWGLETAMDVEWAHAIAPAANILLVEGSGGNMENAVGWARQQPGVSVVSMSWGGAEPGASSVDSYFTSLAGHNVTFVASSGDYGAYTPASGGYRFGASWPASLPSVLSVGGTTLNVNTSGTYYGESTWSGSGGGYSRSYAEPSYQYGVQHTGVRAVPDVSYDADPGASGIDVYCTAPNLNRVNGWTTGGGGTSAGAPQWAGIIALADQGRALVGLAPLDGSSQTLPAIYRFQSDFHDITSGNNGYYSAGTGWDPVTGVGTPIGLRLVGDLAFHTPGQAASTQTPAVRTPSMPTGSLGNFGVVSSLPTMFPDQAPTRPDASSTSITLAPPSLALATTATLPLDASTTGRVRHAHHDLALDAFLEDSEVA